jgi:hypothetical protein
MVFAAAFGPEQPVASNADAAGRAQNRRVEMAPVPKSADRQPDLKSLRQFGDSWSKLGASQAVNQALAAAPPNAGPLNSHALMLQALKLMRDTAPDYLVRFLAHADTLLWLEQANSRPLHAKKAAGRSKAAPRRTPTPTRR